MSRDAALLQTGLTTREVARRYRVGEDKLRGWITRGELRAINTATALCGRRPRWVIPQDALAEFERRRSGGVHAKPQRRRRQRFQQDFYPD